MKTLSVKLFIFYISLAAMLFIATANFIGTYAIPKFEEMQKSLAKHQQENPKEPEKPEKPVTPNSNENKNDQPDNKDKEPSEPEKDEDKPKRQTDSQYPEVIQATNLSNSLIKPNPKV